MKNKKTKNSKKRGPKYSPFSKEFYIHYRDMSDDDASYMAKSKRPCNKEYWIEKGFSETEAIEKIHIHQTNATRKRSEKMKSYPEKYSDIFPNQTGYWVKRGYSSDGAKDMVKKRQTTNSVENLMLLHNCSKEAAIVKRNEITKKWISTLSNKSSEEIIEINKRKLITRNHFNSQDDWKKYCMSKASTLENFIRRHGKDIGTKKYTIYHSKQQGRYTLKWFNDKYGEDIGTNKYNDRISKWHIKHGNVSKESIKFFIPLYKKLRKLGFDKSDFMFGIQGNTELYLLDEDDKRFYYDFTIKPIKVILEYHGIGFHPNPRWLKENVNKWESWEHPFDKYSADIKFHIDFYKKELAETHGYTFYEIYSDDNVKKIREDIYNEIK